jgi:hypothetical protein
MFAVTAEFSARRHQGVETENRASTIVKHKSVPVGQRFDSAA